MSRKGQIVYIVFAALMMICCRMAFKNLSQPFGWILFLISFFCLFSVLIVSGRKRLGFLALFSTFFLLAALEIIVGRITFSCQEKTYATFLSGRNAPEGAYWRLDPHLGYRAAPGMMIHAHKQCGGQDIYDVRYTIDGTGQRDLPRPDKTEGTPILIFGDSFAFGMGVQDDQTITSYIEKESGWRFRTYNFAFNGYGPHQTYSILHRKLEAPYLRDRRPAISLYYAAFDLNRAAGWSYWDKSGPMYERQPDGKLHYSGPFSSSVKHRFFFLFDRSSLFRNLVSPHLAGRRARELFIELMAESGEIIHNRYQSQLLVFLWGSGQQYDATIDRLLEAGVFVVKPADVFPDYEKNPEAYVIRNDSHPLPGTNETVAKFILSNFLQR